MTLSELFAGIGDFLSECWKDLIFKGISFTLLLALIAVVGGAVIGSLFAIGRMSHFGILRGIIIAIVEVVRGTPSLLQLYVGYFLLPAMFPKLNLMDPTLMAFISVSVALTINSAAYVSEIIRSGIEAVDKGQTEASRSLGLTSGTTMIHVVLPQAIKNILPALGNEFITVIKETSLASTFFVGELMTIYRNYVGIHYDSLSPLIVVGIIYFVLDFLLSKGMKAAERKMKAHA